MRFGLLALWCRGNTKIHSHQNLDVLLITKSSGSLDPDVLAGQASGFQQTTRPANNFAIIPPTRNFRHNRYHRESNETIALSCTESMRERFCLLLSSNRLSQHKHPSLSPIFAQILQKRAGSDMSAPYRDVGGLGFRWRISVSPTLARY